MRLYCNDALATPQADLPAIQAALERLAGSGLSSLELRRDSDSRFRVERIAGALMLEISRPDALYGLAIPIGESGDVAVMLDDYARGLEPKLPWEKVPGGAGGFSEIALGDESHPDCPLCAAGRSR